MLSIENVSNFRAADGGGWTNSVKFAQSMIGLLLGKMEGNGWHDAVNFP